MKTRFFAYAFCCIFPFFEVCFGQSDYVTTNLVDKLKTEVKYDRSTGLDIRRLNLDSIHADKHKARHTALRNMSIDVPAPSRIIMARPLEGNSYLDIDALKKNDKRHMFIYDLKNNVLVKDLNPTLVIMKDQYDISSFKLATISIDNSSVNVPIIDTSRYSVEVTQKTYDELKRLKQMYDFEFNYSQAYKEEKKLDDLKKVSREIYSKWIDVFASNKTCNIALVQSKKMWKTISEAWLLHNRYSADDRQNMFKNLEFFKNLGYDSVLVRFDCSEDIDKLIFMMSDIKSRGFDLFATYVGQDNLNPAWNPFIDPDTIERFLSKTAPMCSGFLLNWRSTSNHIKLLPIEFFNYMCNTLRKSNPDILIYGEIYYGLIGPLNTSAVVCTIPSNVTGVVINNMGYYGYNITYIVNELFVPDVPKYRDLDKLGQVIGYGPYYLTKQSMGYEIDVESEYKYKGIVEKAFNRTRHGTVTLSHDGVDDNYTAIIGTGSKTYDVTDNIIYDTRISLKTKTNEGKQK